MCVVLPLRVFVLGEIEDVSPCPVVIVIVAQITLNSSEPLLEHSGQYLLRMSLCKPESCR